MQPFRKRAIKAYLDRDARGVLLQIAPPALSRLLLSIAIVFVVAVVTSAFVRAKITARGRGVVRPADGVVIVRAPAEGVVRSIEASVGQQVRAGDVLLRLDTPVFAPVAGVIDALPVHRDDYVTVGKPIVKIVPSNRELIGYLALSWRYRAHLSIGQPIRLAFDEYPSSEMGFGEGRIIRISEDVITPELASAYLVENDASQGPRFLVQVALERLPPGATKGPLHNGMPFEGVVPVREQRVLTLLLRPLSRFLRD